MRAKKLKMHLILILSICFGLIILTAGALVGQTAWNQEIELTKKFESCMDQAPFRNVFDIPKPEKVLSVRQLESHFIEFDNIFQKTSLPPIWNGEKLVPWKEFHKESIKIAKQCHDELGIKRPQKQLHGTYSKAVWDPNSEIWNNSTATNKNKQH